MDEMCRCIEAASGPSSASPMSSKPLPIIPQITLKHTVAGPIHLFIYHARDGTTLENVLHFYTKGQQQSALPHSVFVTEMSLVFSVGGATAGGRGVGWQTGDRPSSLSPRLASAHCCQPSSNQQSSMSLAAEGVSNQLLAPS